MEEGPPPVLEESIFADDPATPTTKSEPKQDVSDAPDISKKVNEEPGSNRVFVPQGNPTAASTELDVTSETEIDEKEYYYVRKSRWVTTFGFENTKYPTIFEFNGRKDFEKDEQDLWGGRLGFGGELHIGKGLVTRTMVEGFYVGTLFSRTLNGGVTAESVKFAYTKKTGQMYGVDVSQSLGWIFDYKTKNPFMDTWGYLTFEPFVEAGIGRANAMNRLNYSWDTGTSPSGSQERYRRKVTDELLNARVGAGFNITSKKGFFLMLRATVNRYAITSRKVEGFTQPVGPASNVPIDEKPKNAKIDPIVIYTLGGGYKF